MPSQFRLLASLLLLAAASASPKSVVKEATSSIDMTFGEPPAASAIKPTQRAPVVMATEDDPDSVDFSEADKPFENIVAPGSNNERYWDLAVSQTVAGEAFDSSDYSSWVALSRSFETGNVSWTPRLGWSRLLAAPGYDGQHTAVAGAYASWEATATQTVGIDAEWTTQDGPDDWILTADWSLYKEWSPNLGFAVGAWGGWSHSARGFLGASLRSVAKYGKLSLSATGNWSLRDQQLINSSKYVSVWGGSSTLLWAHGNWTTGPNWSCEYWEAPAVSTKKIAKNNDKAPASGEEFDQVVGWSLSRSWASTFKATLSLVKNYGSSTIEATRSNQKAKNPKANVVLATMPDNSLGATLDLSVSW